MVHSIVTNHNIESNNAKKETDQKYCFGKHD